MAGQFLCQNCYGGEAKQDNREDPLDRQLPEQGSRSCRKQDSRIVALVKGEWFSLPGRQSWPQRMCRGTKISLNTNKNREAGWGRHKLLSEASVRSHAAIQQASNRPSLSKASSV